MTGVNNSINLLVNNSWSSGIKNFYFHIPLNYIWLINLYHYQPLGRRERRLNRFRSFSH